MAKPIPTEFEKRDALAADESGEVVLRAATADDDGETSGFEGYVSTWMTVDSYATAFAPGAFRKSIRDKGADRIPVLWQHWPDVPIGYHRSLKEDKTGLYVNAVLIDDDAEGTTALKRLRGGVPFGLSFGFVTRKDRSATDDDELDFSVAPDWAKKLPREDIRVIETVQYWESSPVTFAANPMAQPSKIRARVEAEFFSTLLDATRAGTLTPDQRADIERFVTSWREATEPDSDTGAPFIAPKARRRDHLVELAALTARYGNLLELTA